MIPTELLAKIEAAQAAKVEAEKATASLAEADRKLAEASATKAEAVRDLSEKDTYADVLANEAISALKAYFGV